MKIVLIVLFILSQLAVCQELRKDVEKVWDEIHRGVYKIDHQGDKGGMYVPVIKDTGEKIYILRDYSQILTYLRPPLIKPRYASCESCLDQENQAYPDILRPRDSCRNLLQQPRYYKKEILTLCLAEIKKSIEKNNSPLTQAQTLKNLYKLPKYQQDFAAAIFTGYGEGRSEDEEEIALIYKTIANRVKYAIKKGCTSANALDVVVQRSQFSMWNKKDPNWKKAISIKNEERSERKQQDRMINIFIKFKNEKYSFGPKNVLDKIYHYRTKKIKTVPAWGKTWAAQKFVKVNGKNFGRSNPKAKNAHYFFKSIAWSFRYLSIRPKISGEEECY